MTRVLMRGDQLTEKVGNEWWGLNNDGYSASGGRQPALAIEVVGAQSHARSVFAIGLDVTSEGEQNRPT
jgi:hypothetical protein